jgi:NAD(P)-dependent dehydrogenase (short-subunit alcohol dehydrogenase family)
VSLQDFRRQIDTDFFGVVHVTKAAIPFMREQRSGHIFQVSSLSARIAGIGLSAYQSAKWAVSGFSTGVAQEVAPFGVSVTVLEPSGMATGWAGSSMAVPPVSEPYRETVGVFAQMVRDTSGNEPIDVADVAQVVAELAGRDDAPLRLLLGADAVQYAGAAATQLAESDAKWRELSESVDRRSG